MKRLAKGMARVGVALALLSAAVITLSIVSDQGKIMMPVKKTAVFAHDEMANLPSLLHIGNMETGTAPLMPEA